MINDLDIISKLRQLGIKEIVIDGVCIYKAE